MITIINSFFQLTFPNPAPPSILSRRNGGGGGGGYGSRPNIRSRKPPRSGPNLKSKKRKVSNWHSMMTNLNVVELQINHLQHIHIHTNLLLNLNCQSHFISYGHQN